MIITIINSKYYYKVNQCIVNLHLIYINPAVSVIYTRFKLDQILVLLLSAYPGTAVIFESNAANRQAESKQTDFQIIQEHFYINVSYNAINSK